jgi:hypothetical protein
MGRNSAEATNACLMRAVRALDDLPPRALFRPDRVDLAVGLLLVAASGEAGCAPAPLVVCTGAGDTATGDTAISAASTPESHRDVAGLEFGDFTTLIYSL